MRVENEFNDRTEENDVNAKSKTWQRRIIKGCHGERKFGLKLRLVAKTTAGFRS